jgi:heat shock protein HslJ
VGGRTGPEPGTGGVAAPSPLEGRTFVASAVVEHGVVRPLVAGTRLRLGFGPGRITAEAGCNTLNADVTVGPQRLEVGEIASTLMGCDPEREEQDRLVAEFLTAGPGWELTARGLTLTAGDLRFDLTDDEAGRALWGRTFGSVEVIESGIVPAPVVEGTQIVLTFTAPDGLTAQAGCNTLRCRVEIGNDRLVVADDVASTRIGCSDDLLAQDEWLAAFLADDPEYALSPEDRLVLTRGSTRIVLCEQPG